MFMSQEKLQTMSMQNFWGVKEVHYGIVQVVNRWKELEIIRPGKGEKDASAPRLLMVVSRQGQSTTERGCF